MDAWFDWVRAITGNASSRSVAALIQRTHPTAQAWMRRPPGPEAVRILAQAFNADVVEGFKAAGWLTDADISRVRVKLSDVSELALIAELQRRAARRNADPDNPFEQGYIRRRAG